MGKIDWFRVLSDLAASGMNNSRVAEYIDVNYDALTYWKKGRTEPNFKHGCELLDLYGQRIPMDSISSLHLKMEVIWVPELEDDLKHTRAPWRKI